MITQMKAAASVPSDQLQDWGPVVEPLGTPIAHLRGRAAFEDKAGAPDVGIWECSPGRWRRQVKSAEFCHFIAGHCTFIADDGQRLEIKAGDALYFPANSLGIWEVHETVRKTYVILP